MMASFLVMIDEVLALCQLVRDGASEDTLANKAAFVEFMARKKKEFYFDLATTRDDSGGDAAGEEEEEEALAGDKSGHKFLAEGRQSDQWLSGQPLAPDMGEGGEFPYQRLVQRKDSVRRRGSMHDKRSRSLVSLGSSHHRRLHGPGSHTQDQDAMKSLSVEYNIRYRLSPGLFLNVYVDRAGA
jgi:hypothetical protein